MELSREKESLLKIQEIDLKLDQIEDGLEKAPQKQRIVAAKMKLAEGEKRLALIEAARNDLQQRVDALQLEIDDFSTRMKAHQATMQGSSDHREVESLSKELGVLLKQKEKRENEGMKLMEKRSELGEALVDTNEKLERFKELEEREMASLKEYYAKLKAVRSALLQKRAELSSAVDEETFKNYEKIREAKGGIGLALYEDGKCGGCQVLLPLAQRNELELSEGRVLCPSCKRLLII